MRTARQVVIARRRLCRHAQRARRWRAKEARPEPTAPTGSVAVQTFSLWHLLAWASKAMPTPGRKNEVAASWLDNSRHWLFQTIAALRMTLAAPPMMKNAGQGLAAWPAARKCVGDGSTTVICRVRRGDRRRGHRGRRRHADDLTLTHGDPFPSLGTPPSPTAAPTAPGEVERDRNRRGLYCISIV